jgi:hypothetical protein
VFDLNTDNRRERFQQRTMTAAGMVLPLIHNDMIDMRGEEAVRTCAMASRVLPGSNRLVHSEA